MCLVKDKMRNDREMKPRLFMENFLMHGMASLKSNANECPVEFIQTF